MGQFSRRNQLARSWVITLRGVQASPPLAQTLSEIHHGFELITSLVVVFDIIFVLTGTLFVPERVGFLIFLAVWVREVSHGDTGFLFQVSTHGVMNEEPQDC